MRTQFKTINATERFNWKMRGCRSAGHGSFALVSARGLAMWGIVGLGIVLMAGCSAQGGPEQSMVTEGSAKHFLSTLNDTLARGEMDKLAALFAADVQRNSPAGSQSGRGEVRAHYERMLKGFDNLRLNPKRVIANGDMAVCECRGTAVHKKSGKHVDLPMAVVMNFNSDGQVVRFFEYYDTGDFKRQLQ